MRYLRILDTQVLENMLLMHGFTAYDGMLYGVTWDEPQAKLAKIDPVTLSYNVVDLASGMGVDIKPAKGYLWAITYWHQGVYLYRIDPYDLSYTTFTWSGIDYPHSITYDNNNTLYISGNSGGILKVDISSVNNPTAEIIPTGCYCHHSMVWCSNTNKLAFTGISIPFTSWEALYNSDKYLFIYNPADNSLSKIGVDYGCTDDSASVGKYAYFAVESIPAYPPWPRTLYKLNTETGAVTSHGLDETVVSPFADGVYYDGTKLIVSYRASGARDGTIVVMNPDFTEIEYFPTAYKGYDLAPDEIAQIGNLYFGTSECASTRRVFSFQFFSKACSEYSTQTECEASGCFWWSDNTCYSEPEILCKDYTNQLECEAAGCYWWSDGYCHANPETPPCSIYTDPTECYIHGCYWWGGACHSMPLNCADITNRDECINAGCYWYNDICHEEAPPSCNVFGNKQDCEAGGCYWWNNACHDKAPTCPDYNTQLECETAGCYWYNNSCHSTVPCNQWTNQSECEAHSCYWWADGICHATPEPMPPIAVIDYINPNPAVKNEDVTLGGHGASEGSILEYEWTSDIVGLLSNYSTFNKSDLPVGSHIISFRVKDNIYGWSYSIADTLVIEEAPVCDDWANRDDCEAAGCYWYNSECHSTAPTCKDYTNQLECEAAGCYWYQDEDGIFRCHSSPPSIIPIAIIDIINPNPATVEIPVTFDGHGYDPDGGTIIAYEWVSDIMGLLSTYRTFTKHDLPIGEHVISFRVKDDEGDWSVPSTSILIISPKPTCPDFNNKLDCETAGCYWYNNSCHSDLPACEEIDNQIDCERFSCYWWSDNTCHIEPEPFEPTAYIDYISPNPAMKGSVVSFRGHGYDPDGTIVSYEWTSDISGFISAIAIFTTFDLQVGSHTISLKVQDNDGNWSSPVIETLIIKELVTCPIAVVSYNTYLVDALGPIREFRDNVLKSCKLGKKFISLYYNRITPILSPLITKHPVLKIPGRVFVKALLCTLRRI